MTFKSKKKRKSQRPKGWHKYGAKPTRTTGGQFYGSQLECDFGFILDMLVKSGELQSVQHQPPAVQFPCGIKWRIDYLVIDKNDNSYYIETKGMDTEAYRLKLKCYKQHRPKPLFVIGRTGSQWHIRVEIDTAHVVNPIKSI